MTDRFNALSALVGSGHALAAQRAGALPCAVSLTSRWSSTNGSHCRRLP